MSYNGSGTFTVTNTFVYDTVISETDVNANFTDIATGLSTAITKDGQTTITDNIPMSTYKFTGLGAGSAATDSANIAQIQAGGLVYAGTAGGTKNALTLSLSPAITAYALPLNFIFKAGSTASDSTVTIAVNGLATKAAEINDAALSASLVIEANKYYSAFYDGTAFQLTKLSSDIATVVAALGYSTTPLTQGTHTIGIPAGGIIPATTNGCAASAQTETTTNKVNYQYLAFDPTSIEYAHFNFPSPKSYNASTMTFIVEWAHPVTTTNFGVVWTLELLALANDDAIDTAYGTGIDVTDTGGTTEDLYQSPESTAVTPANTPAKQDHIFARISRKATDGSDTLAVDAHLISVTVLYTVDAGNDA